MVGELSMWGEGRPTRTTGPHGSENADTSSDKTSEKLVRRKPKVSWGRLIRPGLVEPKTRPKGVVDGYPVNIPEPVMDVIILLAHRRLGDPSVGCLGSNL